jgi:uncharacterized protein (DUF2237 family)
VAAAAVAAPTSEAAAALSLKGLAKGVAWACCAASWQRRRRTLSAS